MDLPYDSHRFLLPLLLNMPSLEEQLVKTLLKCVKQCILVNTNMCLLFFDFIRKVQIA